MEGGYRNLGWSMVGQLLKSTIFYCDLDRVDVKLAYFNKWL